MPLEPLLEKLKTNFSAVEFDEVITAIDSSYDFTPSPFTNGTLVNKADENSGSCKIFAFAKLHKLSGQQTLHCFGDYYRKDVLDNPQGKSHQNIRNFMNTGWAGISFQENPLSLR